jgi:hypothetical protein
VCSPSMPRLSYRLNHLTTLWRLQRKMSAIWSILPPSGSTWQCRMVLSFLSTNA